MKCDCKGVIKTNQSGDLRNRYALEYEIARGSIARVFKGYDSTYERPVAVKVMRRPENERQRCSFQHGVKTAKKFSHPNIARTYEMGEAFLDGIETPYAVMEYVPGRTLQDLANERGGLSDAEVTNIGAGIASALSYVHSRGIVHRDIRPANILLTPGNVAVLIDFADESALPVAIQKAHPIGAGQTRYASPEHVQPQLDVSAESDVYSLGATLYRLASGRAPFRGTAAEVANKHVSHRPVPLRNLTRISGRLDQVVMGSLRKSPLQRPNASEITAILVYELASQRVLRSVVSPMRATKRIRSIETTPVAAVSALQKLYTLHLTG